MSFKKTGNELWALFITMRLSFFCPFQKIKINRKKQENNIIPLFSVCDINFCAEATLTVTILNYYSLAAVARFALTERPAPAEYVYVH